MRENASNFHPRRLIQGLLLKPFNYLRLEWAPQYTSVASRTVADIRKTRRAAIVKICLLRGGACRGEKGWWQWRQWWAGQEASPLQGESIWAHTVNLGSLSPLSVPRDRVKDRDEHRSQLLWLAIMWAGSERRASKANPYYRTTEK